MASQLTRPAEAVDRETRLLGRLVGLYEEECQVYGRILDLSRRQGESLRRGAPFGEIQALLEQKKGALDVIARLEAMERRSKSEWEQGRDLWTARGRGRLTQSLQRVSDLIEEILTVEERNDQVLIQQAGGL